MFQMPDRMKKGLAALALAGSLLGATVVGAAAAPPNPTQRGGAAGLVAAVVQAIANVDVRTGDIDVAVVELNNSLNNLTALNNVLNNSPILSNNDIIDDITVINGDVTVTDVLNDAQIAVLNDVVDLENVVIVAIVELLSGDFIVITQ